MPNSTPQTLAAIDLGHGHIKWGGITDLANRQDLNGAIFGRAPSKSPQRRPMDRAGSETVMQRRDTFLVPVDGDVFEVGKDVDIALASHHEGEILDSRFAETKQYTARMYGALNYLADSLKTTSIDLLVLGLPLTTHDKYQQTLAERFKGRHVIATAGRHIEIGHCVVYPQPLGAYAAYLATLTERPAAMPRALVIDPGYNTVDWFVCQGMTPVWELSDANECGMNQIIRRIAEEVCKDLDADPSAPELVRLIDRALLRDQPLHIFGKKVDLTKYRTAGESVADQAIHAVKNMIRSGGDIDVIVLTGGGQSFYRTAVETRFPHHRVMSLDEPAFATVRGFLHLGGLQMRSMRKAAQAIAHTAAGAKQHAA